MNSDIKVDVKYELFKVHYSLLLHLDKQTQVNNGVNSGPDYGSRPLGRIDLWRNRNIPQAPRQSRSQGYQQRDRSPQRNYPHSLHSSNSVLALYSNHG